MPVSRVLLVLLLTFASPLVCADEEATGVECVMDAGMGHSAQEAAKILAGEEAKISQAEQKEKAGNTRAAYDILNNVGTGCMSYASIARIEKIKKRLENKLGHEDEKNGHFKESFDWFRKSENHSDIEPEKRVHDDSARVMMKIAHAQPEDLPTFGKAFEYIKFAGKPDQLKTLRALAFKNVRQILADEDKQFFEASRMSSGTLGMLGKAKDWLKYVEAPENRLAAERAEKRGDTLSVETTKHFLSQAVYYYGFADKPEKVKLVRGKAKKLGDEAKGKGEGEVAAEFYQLAGLSEQASSLRESTKTKRREEEGNRKQKFKKDQASMEKEFGM